MEELIRIGREFVAALKDGRGIEQVGEMYAENAESVEAVVPPDRDMRIAKGRSAIEAKREDWAATHEIHRFGADGPYVHPPNRFSVRFEVDVTQKETGRRRTLREIAVYSVQNGRIVREEFFMMPK